MASKKFHARHGLSVGIGTSAIDVIDSTGTLLIIPQISASNITSGTISADRLPSYVDDVLEAANIQSLPGTGEAGKIYVTLDNNKVYRWSGSTYVLVGGDLSLYLTTTAASIMYLQSATAAATYQPLDADLTAIAALTSTPGLLKKTGANSWQIDTSAYISTAPGTTGNVLTSNGTTWVSQAPTGGGGGSVDLTAVTQNIVPSINYKYNLGSSANRWKDVYIASSADINANGISLIGTVTDVTTTPGPIVPKELPSAASYNYSQTNALIDGMQWNGVQYGSFSISNYAIDNTMSGMGYIYRMNSISDLSTNTIISSMVGQTVLLLDESSQNSFSMVIDAITSDGGFDFWFNWHAVDSASAQTISGIFYDYNISWNWGWTKMSYNSQGAPVTVITTNGTTVPLPSSTLITVNGSTADIVGAKTPTTTVGSTNPSFTTELGNVYMSTASLVIEASSSQTVLPSWITSLGAGKTVTITYIDSADSTATIREAVYNITGVVNPEDQGYGVWKVYIWNLTFVSEPSPWITTHGTIGAQNVTIVKSTLWDVSGFTNSSSNAYSVSKTYTAFPVGTVLGYVNSPKLKLGSDLLGGGFEITYDIINKKAVYEGLSSPLEYFTSLTTMNRAIQTSGVRAPNVDYSGRNKSVIIGDNAYAGNGSVSVGYEAGFNTVSNSYDSQYSVAIGQGAQTRAPECTAVGFGAVAAGQDATALGTYAVAASYSLALGYNANANYDSYTIAIGQGSTVDAYSGIAIGNTAYATGNCVAIGTQASAKGWNSIAIGNGAQVGPGIQNTVSIGYYSGCILPGAFNFATTGQSYFQHPTVKFQYWHSGTMGTTRYLQADGNGGTTPRGYTLSEMFAWQGYTAGMAIGTATFLTRGQGQTSASPMWKIVEVKFTIYMHDWNARTSLSNYDLRIISTNTIASSANTGHTAWTYGVSIELNDSGTPVLCGKITKTDTLQTINTIKFNVELMNTYSN